MALHRDLTYQNGIHGIVAFVFANTNDRDAYTPKTTDLHKVARVGEEYHLLTSLTPVTWETLGSGGTSGTGDIDASQVTSGIFDIARIPAAALERVTVVSDQAARYGLTIDTVQLGDTVKQSDTGVMYRVIDVANLNNAAGYMEYTAGSAASVPWTGVTGKPTTLSGYGITDGYTDADAEAALSEELAGKENADPAIQAHIVATGNPHGTTPQDIGAEPANANIQAHILATDNPHSTSAEQVGAEPADPAIQAHIGATGNPHGATYTDIGAAPALHDHVGVYEPANTNIQGHITEIGNPHSTTAADVGAEPADAAIQAHITSTNNPHGVSVTQIGAEPADANIQAHIINTENPHGISPTQIGAAEALHSHPASGLTNDSSVAGATIKDALETLESSLSTGGYTDADAKAACVADTITDGVTDVAPSQNVVYDALDTKENADPAIQSHITATGNAHGATPADIGAEPADPAIQAHVATIAGNPHGTTYTDVGAAPALHDHAGVYEPADTAIQSHITQVTGNPHNVTLDELGISTSGVSPEDVTGHVAATNNPHNVTAAQVGAVASNTAITGGTHTKITYDSKGLVTAGENISASDVPNLDASKVTSGIFDIARIPAAAIERMVPVADQTARFALTIDTVQLGDTVKQLDTGIMYVVIDVANLNNASGYAEYTAATAAAVPWSGVTDKPTTLAGYGITDGYTDADAQDACVAQTITDGVTTSAPSQDAIFDALAGKEDADPAIQSHITATGNPHSTTAVDVGAEPAFTKNTAFNKNFGSAAATVCEGNDARLSDARTPTAHTHVTADVTDIVVSDTDLSSLGGGGIAEVTGTAPISVANGTTAPAVSISAATTSAAGSMSAADKLKLDGIEAGAQANVPADLSYTAAASTGTVVSSTGTDATVPAATTSLAGLLTAADKLKLDGIDAGAQVNVGTNIGTGTITTTAVPLTSSTGTGTTLNAATTSLAGVMSAADKSKLDGVASGATANTGTVTNVSGTAPISVADGTTTPSITISAATTSAAGSMSATDKTKLNGIASGATANVASDATPAAATTTGAAGSSASYARGDHAHPSRIATSAPASPVNGDIWMV